VFEGMSVKRPGPDHIGFHVENLTRFLARVAEVAGMNPYLAGVPLGGSPESDVRKRFFAESGERQMADVRSRRELDRHHRRSDGVHSSHVDVDAFDVGQVEGAERHFWNSLRRASPSEP